MSLRVSIVTPSFNQRAYLEATLDSVLSQEYPGLEYVVVDGGSDDGSAAVIEERADRLSWWVSEADAGLYDALNKGFAHTSGEVMGWINSSDLHYPWTLQTVAEIFSQLPDVQWVMGMSSRFSGSGGPRSVRAGRFNVYDVLAGDYRWIQQESVFWRRELWERAGGRLDDRLRRAADFELWLRFLRLAPLYHVETILGGWRVHDDHLGELGGGRYSSEAEEIAGRFAAAAPQRLRRRAGLVRAAGRAGDRDHLVGRTMHKLGVWPWYAHPKVVFDFEAGSWVTR
jgi:glycosyltransferase involved in cell wall biosynthesis